MQNIYFGAVFTAIVVYLLVVVLLFMQRKKGERSRMILAAMTLLSVFNYVGMMVYFYTEPTYGFDTVIDIPFLLLGIFITTIYYMYPIEVVSPGWITWRRLVKMYMPLAGIWLFYCATLLLGVEYTLYPTIGDMMADLWSFQVIFRIVLALLVFMPAVLLYYVPYASKYNNTNQAWMRGYVVVANINTVTYLYANIDDTFLVCTIYIFISLMCSLYFTYQELFVRLIRQPIKEPQLIVGTSPEPKTEAGSMQTEPEVEVEVEAVTESDSPRTATVREAELFERLEKYMNSEKAWRDPDLSSEKLVSELFSNRTLMLKAVQKHGYSGYSSYVNSKRVAEFIQIINQRGEFNYLQTLFDVGFRSKTSALRNFKEITGTIPSKYFQQQTKGQ